MDLTICVVSWNTRELLRRCLESIASTLDALTYEVVVVDNASTDGSAEMVARDFPWVRLVRNATNRGFAAANNQAIVVSQGRHVLLLNSDAVLLPGTAVAMVRYLDAHPEVGVVGAQLLNADGTFQASYADFPTLLGEALLLTGLARLVYPRTYPSYPERASQVEREVDWVFGACLLARRSAIAAVGSLDEDYFMYTEETDWCYRMRRGGWKVAYLPSARVIHWAGQSANTAPLRKRAQLYRSKWLFLRKWRGEATATIFQIALRVASILKLLGWAVWGLSPRPTTRAWSRQQVRSYALLLKEL